MAQFHFGLGNKLPYGFYNVSKVSISETDDDGQAESEIIQNFRFENVYIIV